MSTTPKNAFYRNTLRVGKTLVILLAVALGFGHGASSVAAETDELKKLQANYEKHISKLLEPIKTRLADDLSSLENRLKKRGDAEGLLAVQEKRIAFALEPAGTPNRLRFPLETADFEGMEALQKDITLLRTRHQKRVAQALNPARRTMIGALKKLEQSLLSSDRPRAAIEAKTKRQAIEKIVDWASVANSLPKGTLVWRDHSYHMFDEKMSWGDAKKRCEKLKGHLVTITSEEENKFLEKIAQGKSCWIGATDEEKEGDWKWITGEPFKFTKWESRPDNHQGRQHHAMYSPGRGWDDMNGASTKRFICEWEMPRE